MPIILNLSKVKAWLLNKKNKEPYAKYSVGYSADYATYVHENLQAYHEPPTRAKYLEEPVRRLRPQMSKIVKEHLANGKSMAFASRAVAELIKIESQAIVPVDTGALKASVFIKKEK